MRTRPFIHSMGLMLFLASLVAAAPSCARVVNGPEDQKEDQLGFESSAVEQAAPAAGLAATVTPGSKLDRQQLAALVGDKTPALVGDSCNTIGSVCAPPINGIIRACGGFTSACDSTGTEDILQVVFLCLPGSGGNVCTAVAGQTPQTIDCTVPTDGKSCGGGCGAPFCAAYPTQCANHTDQVRNCLSAGVCSNGACTNQTSSQEIVGSCTRDTEGQSCSPVVSCGLHKFPLCTVNGNCACLTGAQ